MVCLDNSCEKEKWTIAWNRGKVYFVWQLQCELLFKADALKDLFWNIPQTFPSKEIIAMILSAFLLFTSFQTGHATLHMQTPPLASSGLLTS